MSDAPSSPLMAMATLRRGRECTEKTWHQPAEVSEEQTGIVSETIRLVQGPGVNGPLAMLLKVHGD